MKQSSHARLASIQLKSIQTLYPRKTIRGCIGPTLDHSRTDCLVSMYVALNRQNKKNIFLKDILEPAVDEKYYLSQSSIAAYEEHKRRNIENGNGFGWQLKTGKDKSGTVITGSGKSKSTYIFEPNNELMWLGNVYGEDNPQAGRVYDPNGKSSTLSALGGGGGGKTGLYEINGRVRKLTPLECERLQTVPDNYTQGVSDTQRYRMIGNGWTIDVITHIFQYLKSEIKALKQTQSVQTVAA